MADKDFPLISDYGFLSDCHSVALVGRDASVEWACFHRFDQRSVFARMLDRERGGFFRIAPAGDYTTTRRYLPETNVLETTFVTSTGTATVTDCLPVQEGLTGRVGHHELDGLLLRTVQGTSGTVDLLLEFYPRFEYGLTTPTSNWPSRTCWWSPAARTPCYCRAPWRRWSWTTMAAAPHARP
ncbi:trehalase-like domain-containing protein [Streptacidiphilus sp. P02-A3a]|uniref:trehalase-like domain-containing protein n=1 Tax=Streptacidiphilus sp. P02-A3a TaxID=2704468 RepID=UPI0015F925BD|nr:trehalase-like domain-containing protein [Streptacidiphilus sp. P02-A3a]QMU69126.1 hypothetical protein GXP74_13600 [Streptacidiphilus sp. P02-A3a]